MIDINKQYRTRSGREVRVYTINGCGCYPIHGAIKYDDGWHIEVWSAEGTYSYPGSEHELDLIEVKPRIKRTVWLNIYQELNTITTANAYRTQEDAEHWCSPDVIARVKIEIDCEEGEGLRSLNTKEESLLQQGIDDAKAGRVSKLDESLLDEEN